MAWKIVDLLVSVFFQRFTSEVLDFIRGRFARGGLFFVPLTGLRFEFVFMSLSPISVFSE